MSNVKQELLRKIADKSAVVGIVGLGYVGLPLAVEMAEAGYKKENAFACGKLRMARCAHSKRCAFAHQKPWARKDNVLQDWISVALPKGRLGEKAYDLFERIGFGCPAIREDNRKLIFENEAAHVRYFWAKPSDVAIYVERGAADVGVAGKDILLEYAPEVYELCDLAMGKCRMMVAGRPGALRDSGRALRVATKFPHIASAYFAAQSRDIEIIKLNGSIEIAPLLGLSDVIVDIVETGTTLKENGLTPLETVVPISARFIANKVSYKFKNARVREMQERLAALIARE